MLLELHIYGPAFGLASIDPECLAAIIYLRRCFGSHKTTNHRETQWHLVASSNLNVSPFHELPALRVRDGKSTNADEDLWVAGFDNIVSYMIEKRFPGSIDIDAQLDDLQHARSYALLSFIRSKGAPILDLSLYVSSENYNSCTRPALGSLLHWPESWILPHKLREDARRRSEHLGLSALDVDAAKVQQEKENNHGLAAHIPKSLRKSTQTVSGLLGKSAQQTKFRLEAVTEEFLQPLSERLEANRHDGLLDTDIHSVDCLAIAYLTLMHQPHLPQPWLRTMLITKYTWLRGWSKLHVAEMLNSALTVKAAVAGQRLGPLALPWKAPVQRPLSAVSLAVIEGLVRTVPGLRTVYDSVEIQPSSPSRRSSSRADRQLIYVDLRQRQVLSSQIIASVIGTTSLLAWLLHAGGLLTGQSKSPSARRNFGEAGSLLGIM